MTGLPIRPDLLDLGVDALTVLANTGLVKRAGREVAAGKLPALSAGPDGMVRARFDDGTVTESRPGQPLRDATCTCVASGMCRHRLVLVLAYQAAGPFESPGEAPDEVPWSPADLDVDTFPAKVLVAARRLTAGGIVVRLTWPADGPASAALPMSHVSFLGRDLANARCDCSLGHGCAHVVLAVQAFRKARDTAVELPATVGLQDEAPADAEPGEQGLGADGRLVRAELGLLADQLWSQGSAQPAIGYEAAVSRLRRRIDGLGWAWVGVGLERLLDQLTAQRTRSSRFDPVQLLLDLAECTARVDAAALLSAQPAPDLPASVVLGVGVPGEVAMSRTRLVSLGARVWRSDEADGVEVWLADPDTQAVMVLERSWPLGGQPVLQRRVVGVPFSQLAAGQVIVTAARRRSNGRVELPRTAHVLPLSPTAWDGLRAPLAGAAPALIDGLRNGPPAWVRPLEVAGAVRVLQVDEVLDWGFDPAAQRLVLLVASGGVSAQVHVPFSSLTPGAVDAAAAALRAGRLHSVAGVATVRAGRLELVATALLTDAQALVVAAGVAGHTRLPPAPAVDRVQPVLQATAELLASTLRQGLRHIGVPGRDRLLAQARRLREAGYPVSAQWLSGAADLIGADHAGSAEQLARLVLLLTAADSGLPRPVQRDPAD